MKERALKVLLLLGLVTSLPSIVHAQALAGVVRDPSGAILPGVTVEAASPALIEKVRSVVTDGTGQYRIVDLRPGTYTLTLTLPGFNTVARTGIERFARERGVLEVDEKILDAARDFFGM